MEESLPENNNGINNSCNKRHSYRPLGIAEIARARAHTRSMKSYVCHILLLFITIIAAQLIAKRGLNVSVVLLVVQLCAIEDMRIRRTRRFRSENDAVTEEVLRN